MAAKGLSFFKIKSAKPAPKGKRLELWDDDPRGLGLRVSDKGHKSFVFLRRRPTAEGPKLWRKTLGDWSETAADGEHGSLSWARSKARALLDTIKAGRDPDEIERAAEAEKKAQKEAATAAEKQAIKNTVAARGEEFIERYLIGTKGGRYGKETGSVFRRDVIGAWGEKQVHEVRRSDVRTLLDKIKKDHGGYAANRRQAAISKFFSWMLAEFDEGETGLQAHPSVGLLARAKETPRKREITDAEMAVIWAATDRMGGAYGALVKLLAILAQRRGDVGSMRRADVDMAKGLWIIPADMAKNRREHVVPLPRSAAAIVAAQIAAVDAYCTERDIEEPGPYVFTTDGGLTALGGWSDFREKLQVHIEAAAAEARAKGIRQINTDNLHIHDLRGLASTGMRKLGTSRADVKAVINHKDGSVLAEHYDMYDMLAEKKAILDRWATHLAGIVSGRPADNVVQLRAAEG